MDPMPTTQDQTLRRKQGQERGERERYNSDCQKPTFFSFFGFSLAVSNDLLVLSFFSSQEPKLNPVAPSFTPRECPTTPFDASKVSKPQPMCDVTNINTRLTDQATERETGSALQDGPPPGQHTANGSTMSTVAPPSASSDVSDRSGFHCAQRGTDLTVPEEMVEPSMAERPHEPGLQFSDGCSKGSLRGRGRGRYSKVRWSRPRYTRRAQSKSEPTVNSERA